MTQGPTLPDDSTLQRDELVTYLLGVRSDAISTIKRTEQALAELGRPVDPAVMTRRERRANDHNLTEGEQ